MSIFVQAVSMLLCIGGLWWLLFRIYRDYRVNRCCKELVALRREMLRWAIQSNIVVNHPAYCTLRNAMNGLISVCQLTSPLEIAFVLMSRRAGSGTFAERLERMSCSVDDNARAQLIQFSDRMHLIMIKYLVLCPLVMMTVVGPVLVWALIKYRYTTFLDWFHAGFDRLDEVALIHEADDILYTFVNTTVPLRGALHSRLARVIRAHVRPYFQRALSSLTLSQRASHRRVALGPQTPNACGRHSPESRLIIPRNVNRISLSFHGTLGLPVRVGPSPWFRVTGNLLRQGPHGAIVGKFHNNTWETAGQRCCSYDVEGPAVVQFEDAFGDKSDVLGPFDFLRSADGLMWANSELFAKFTTETQLWHHINSDTYWPAMIFEATANGAQGFPQAGEGVSEFSNEDHQ